MTYTAAKSYLPYKNPVFYFSLPTRFLSRCRSFSVLILFVLIFFLTLHKNSDAQIFKPGLSIGMHAGTLVFFGDIKTNDFMPSISGYNELRSGGGIQGIYQLNPVLAIRASIMAGKLAGADQDEDKYFEANILDYTLQGLISLNSLIFYDYDITPADIYAVLGYGFVEFRTIKRRLSDDAFIKAFGYKEDGSKASEKTREMVIPVGIMVHSNISNLFNTKNYFFSKVDITFEFVLHNANTNKLDADLTIREVKDKYTYFALGLIYRII